MNKVLFFVCFVLISTCARGQETKKTNTRLLKMNLTSLYGDIIEYENHFYDTKLKTECSVRELEDKHYYCIPVDSMRFSVVYKNNDYVFSDLNNKIKNTDTFIGTSILNFPNKNSKSKPPKIETKIDDRFYLDAKCNVKITTEKHCPSFNNSKYLIIDLLKFSDSYEIISNTIHYYKNYKAFQNPVYVKKIITTTTYKIIGYKNVTNIIIGYGCKSKSGICRVKGKIAEYKESVSVTTSCEKISNNEWFITDFGEEIPLKTFVSFEPVVSDSN